MPAVIKRILSLAGVGAALGFLAWSILGQQTTSIMYGSLGGSITCAPDVESALKKFVMMQLYCAIGGAVVIPILGFLIMRSFKKKKPVGADPGAASPG